MMSGEESQSVRKRMWKTMVLTKSNKDTSNRLARQQLHLNHVVTSSLKNILKLDQIAERKIRISLDKLVCSFLKVKL